MLSESDDDESYSDFEPEIANGQLINCVWFLRTIHNIHFDYYNNFTYLFQMCEWCTDIVYIICVNFLLILWHNQGGRDVPKWKGTCLEIERLALVKAVHDIRQVMYYVSLSVYEG
jgi:hypothetical protein